MNVHNYFKQIQRDLIQDHYDEFEETEPAWDSKTIEPYLRENELSPLSIQHVVNAIEKKESFGADRATRLASILDWLLTFELDSVVGKHSFAVYEQMDFFDFFELHSLTELKKFYFESARFVSRIMTKAVDSLIHETEIEEGQLLLDPFSAVEQLPSIRLNEREINRTLRACNRFRHRAARKSSRKTEKVLEPFPDGIEGIRDDIIKVIHQLHHEKDQIQNGEKTEIAVIRDLTEDEQIAKSMRGSINHLVKKGRVNPTWKSP
jgi:hypothetical protein